MKRTAGAMLITSLFILVSCGGGGGGSTSFTTPPASTGPLLITTTSLPTGLTGKAYTAGIIATGGAGKLNYSISLSSFFPAGLTLDPTTGAISGMVSNAVFGDVTFQVTDSGSPRQTALKTIRMTFNWSMEAVAGTSPIPQGHLNVPYHVPFYAGGSNGNVAWTISSGQLPPGLTLNNVNSTEADLDGTPTAAGTYSFALQVVDSSTPPQTASISNTIAVDSNLAIATTSLPVPYVNEAYSQSITAVNGTPPYHWSGQLPGFLHIDAVTGVLSGTGSMGNYWASVTVTDSATPPQTASQNYTMLVLPRLAITGSTLPDANVNGNYYTGLPSVGGQGNLSWSITSGSLPPGLTLQPRYGILSGTPTQVGTYTFSVQLQDSSTPPQVAQGQLTIAVRPEVLALQNSLPIRIPVNVPFEGVAAVTGGTPPYTWTLWSNTFPPGLSLDSATGKVSGTPDTQGAYSPYVEVTDSSSPQQSAFLYYNITVGPVLGRNDSPATATKIANLGHLASLSPLLDPPTGSTISPDTDYYRITGTAGATIQVNINAVNSVLDPVLELVDANGARLNNCRVPGDSSNNFNSACLNDDIDSTTLNSQLEYRVPGTAGQLTDIYAHVVDWRGDARPDMTYSIIVSGAFEPIVFDSPGQLQDVAANHGYNQNIRAHGGTGTLTGAVTGGQLPPGVTLANQSSFHNYTGPDDWFGSISGNPTTAGTYTFTITITDSATPQQSVSQQFTVHVFPQIQLATVPDQVLKAGQTTTYQASASGGVPPLHFFLTGWQGATVDANSGLITFQPTAAGQFSFQLWVQGSGADSGTEWANQNINVTVNP